MLSNKNIIVTGCQHEIGRGAVVAAALNGANVFACTYKETDEYREFCEKTADDANVEVIPVYFDGTDDESIRRAVKIIEKTDMDIHGLINAGEISSDVPFGIISSSDMEEVFRVNVFSQILFTQHISRLMLNKHTEGSIAFVSNISGLDGNLEYGGG
jgi:3-oxoacyl-[acyl-carrier protein] reductase